MIPDRGNEIGGEEDPGKSTNGVEGRRSRVANRVAKNIGDDIGHNQPHCRTMDRWEDMTLRDMESEDGNCASTS